MIHEDFSHSQDLGGNSPDGVRRERFSLVANEPAPRRSGANDYPDNSDGIIAGTGAKQQNDQGKSDQGLSDADKQGILDANKMLPDWIGNFGFNGQAGKKGQVAPPKYTNVPTKKGDKTPVSAKDKKDQATDNKADANTGTKPQPRSDSGGFLDSLFDTVKRFWQWLRSLFSMAKNTAKDLLNQLKELLRKLKGAAVILGVILLCILVAGAFFYIFG